MFALLVSVPDPAHVEPSMNTLPAESVAGPFTVNVRLVAENVAFDEFSV